MLIYTYNGDNNYFLLSKLILMTKFYQKLC